MHSSSAGQGWGTCGTRLPQELWVTQPTCSPDVLFPGLLLARGGAEVHFPAPAVHVEAPQSLV